MTENRKKIFLYLLLGAYIIVNLVLLYYHEPWRDEAQIWILSRDLPIWKLPRQMSYEGHPCLWHVLMYPFAHFGLPYLMQNAAAFVIVTCAAALLIFRSSFPLYVRAILVFSPFLTYYYPVIARNYCMIPLFLFLLAYWYPSRLERPVRYTLVIALLVQSHAVMIMTAFSLSLCFLAENCIRFYQDRDGRAFVKRTSPLLLPLASAVFLLYELMSVEKSSLLHIKTASVSRTMEKIIDKTVEGLGTLCGFDGKKGLILLLIGAVFLLLAAFRRKAKAKYTVVTVLTLTYCFQFWFYAMVYNYSMQRLMTYPLLIIWGMWVLKTESASGKEAETAASEKQRGIAAVLRPAELVFCAFCLLALFHCVPEIRLDVETPYSNGRETAAFIKSNIPDEAVILTDNQAEVTAIFPYLDRKDYIYAPNGQNFTFVTWDDHWMDKTDYASFSAWFNGLSTDGKPVYMISCVGRSYIEGSEQLAQDYELIYQSLTASVKGEDYAVYRLR
ncbi:MAG: hypothetical protein J6C33_02645 [Lachnospiraceae bacterium]|nr:hypothetical protein [Lachnospiraceae bacterium]